MIWTKQHLIEQLESGAAPDLLLFWGHTPKRPDVVDASCLSQWFPRGFRLDGLHYPTAEHYMMAAKARLFGDEAALAKILEAGSPGEVKALGRAVANYDERAWEEHRFDAVVRGNVAKFGAHADLGAYLRSTGAKVLVEAAPRDVVWGIGLGAANPAARDPRRWRGRNLLGFALMEARRQLG